jgi:hypothetical protein
VQLIILYLSILLHWGTIIKIVKYSVYNATKSPFLKEQYMIFTIGSSTLPRNIFKREHLHQDEEKEKLTSRRGWPVGKLTQKKGG